MTIESAKYRRRIYKGETTKIAKPLVPWQFAFVEWLAQQPERPSIDMQLSTANQILKETHPDADDFTRQQLSRLKSQKEFKEYYGKIQGDLLTRARAKLERQYEKAVDAHYEGLKMALEANDHRSITPYTIPILDRVAPKRDEGRAVAAVSIELTTKQHELLDRAVPVVEVEVIEDDDSG